MVAGPIPHTSIIRHTEGWPDDDAEMFYQCMEAMDAVYFEKATVAPIEHKTPEEQLKAIFGGSLPDIG